MKAKTITLLSKDGINKSLDIDEVIPPKALETTTDSDEATITISPPVENEALNIMRNYSIWHKKCLKAVAQDVTLNGFKITPKQNQENNENQDTTNKELLENLFSEYQNSQALFKTMRDFRTYTHAVFELVLNLEGKLRGFKHIRARTIKMCEGGEKALQTIGSKTRYFRVYGQVRKENEDLYLDSEHGDFSLDVPEDRRASSIIWLSNGSEESDYYHEPDYLEAAPTILSDYALDSYNYDGLSTNGIPNYLIMIAGDFEAEENDEGKTFDEDLEDTFQSVPNKPGTAMVIPIKTTGKEAGLVIDVHKLAEPIQEGSYLKLSESNRDKILAAHEVPASRLGLVINGPLAGSVDEERNKLYDSKTVKPLRLMLDTVLNRLISDLLEIDDYQHEFTGIDTKNVKSELEIATEIVDHGAMTPAQLLEAFGDHFNLNVDIQELITNFPELNQYYYNGQLLGSSPDPGIMKSLDGEMLPEKVARILEVTADKIEGIRE